MKTAPASGWEMDRQLQMGERPILAVAGILAASLVAAPGVSAEALRTTAGLRLGWLSTVGAAREILASGAPEPEGYIEVARSSSPLSLEASLSGYSLPGVESGSAVFTQTGLGTFPTGFAYTQNLLVIPMRLTLKIGPRSENFSAHMGAGIGGVFTYIRRTLSFSDPNAQAALSQTNENENLGLETHVQLGADWRIGDNFGAGLLARWSYAQSGVALNHGFQGASMSGATFTESRSAGNVAGLTLGASGWWRF